jgi:hypothetical protein
MTVDYGIVHFLVQEDEGRSIEQSSIDVMRASFLSLRFESPLHEFLNRAELKEITEEDFTLRKGSRIGPNEIRGMQFWWLRLASAPSAESLPAAYP